MMVLDAPGLVLIVDDEPQICRVLSKILASSGVLVESRECGASALERLAEVGQPKPSLVMTDIYMPEMDGITLARRIATEHPEVHVIFMSGDDQAAEGMPANAEIILKGNPEQQKALALRVKGLLRDLAVKAQFEGVKAEMRASEGRTAAMVTAAVGECVQAVRDVAQTTERNIANLRATVLGLNSEMASLKGTVVDLKGTQSTLTARVKEINLPGLVDEQVGAWKSNRVLALAFTVICSLGGMLWLNLKSSVQEQLKNVHKVPQIAKEVEAMKPVVEEVSREQTAIRQDLRTIMRVMMISPSAMAPLPPSPSPAPSPAAGGEHR